jgi:DNA-binding MarR family transcriptional regulator
MEQDGLIARVPHTGDRRTNYVELTPKGLELSQRLVPAVAHYSVEACVALSDAERESFIRLLRILSEGAEQAQTE